MRNLDKKDLTILTIINNHSENMLGITLADIYSVIRGRFEVNIQDLHGFLINYEKESLIRSKIKGVVTFYYMGDKESKKLDKILRKLKQSDFMGFLSILPLEISNRYRIRSLENTIFWGVFGWILFQLVLFLIRFQRIILALIILPISFLCIGLSIGYLSRILTIIIYRFFNLVKSKTKKTGKSKLFLWLSYFGKFIKKHLNKLTFIFLVIVGLSFALPILLSQDNKAQFLYNIAFGIFAIIVIVVWKIIFKEEPKEAFLEMVKSK